MKPSNSTIASAVIGVPIATILAWLISLVGVVMPDNVEAAFGAVISAAVGYLFLGGKKSDTEDSGNANSGV